VGRVKRIPERERGKVKGGGAEGEEQKELGGGEDGGRGRGGK
jgi:hypothetical protein